MSPGQLIKEARRRHGLSQTRLAIRAGTKQSAISRLENDETSPTFDTVQTVLRAMCEEIEIGARQVASSQDPLHRKEWLARTPAERLELGLAWNRLALELEQAGRAAKGS